MAYLSIVEGMQLITERIWPVWNAAVHASSTTSDGFLVKNSTSTETCEPLLALAMGGQEDLVTGGVLEAG